MVDTASIIVAIISLLGAVLAALFTGYTTYLADERKRQHQIQAEVRKYSDPLLVTAWDLQDRLFELLDTTITKFDRTNDNAKENLDLFTCYLLAQFLAWRYILKIKTQFLAFTEDKSTNKLKEVLEKISEELSTSRYGRNQWQFRMWPGHQLAIAENMVDLHSENGETSELHPMGWHHFRHGFDERFGFYFRWFRDSIKDLLDAKFEKEEEARKEKAGRAEKEKADGAILKMTGEPGLVKVDGAKDEKVNEAKKKKRLEVPDQRLRRLQHFLVDLIDTLDSAGQIHKPRKCGSAIECDCRSLDCNGIELAEKRFNRTRSSNTAISSEKGKT